MVAFDYRYSPSQVIEQLMCVFIQINCLEVAGEKEHPGKILLLVQKIF